MDDIIDELSWRGLLADTTDLGELRAALNSGRVTFYAGFDPTAETDGFGLLGMRERVELLDGTLRLDSTPGRGTTVRASFPVQRRAAAAVRDIRSGR